MSWLVFMTEPDALKAMTKIERGGFDAFLPLCWRQDKKIPLYGRYAFADEVARWWTLHAHDGVSRVLTIEDSPCLIADEVIGDLMLRMVQGGGAIGLAPNLEAAEFHEGQLVRVRQGKYVGLIGRWKVARNGHSRIDIDNGRGKTTISVATHHLAPLVSGSAALQPQGA